MNFHPLIAKIKTDLDATFEQYMASEHPKCAHNSQHFAVISEAFATAQLLLIQYLQEHAEIPPGLVTPALAIRSRQAFNNAQRLFNHGTDNPDETVA